jgi:hypothetical protein
LQNNMHRTGKTVISNIPYSCGQPKPTTFIVAERLVEIVQFCGIIFSFEKGVNCTFFGIFS